MIQGNEPVCLVLPGVSFRCKGHAALVGRAAKGVQLTRSARRPGMGNDLRPQLTRLEQSGSGYELHLVLSLSANCAASVLGQDLASYRLRRGPAVHLSSFSSFCSIATHAPGTGVSSSKVTTSSRGTRRRIYNGAHLASVTAWTGYS
jgi:hypothetical protein